MNGLSRKIYLELPLPTEDDPRSDQQRILDSLAAAGVEERVHIPATFCGSYTPCWTTQSGNTVSLAWNGGKLGKCWRLRKEIPPRSIMVWRWIWEAPLWWRDFWTATVERF